MFTLKIRDGDGFYPGLEPGFNTNGRDNIYIWTLFHDYFYRQENRLIFECAISVEVFSGDCFYA